LQNRTVVRFCFTVSHPASPTLIQRPARGRPKGQQTRAAILDVALRLAAHVGLEGLSIGGLADAASMSKSGVFAHFGSREELQISVVREYYARFEQQVFAPAMTAPRGLPRLRALFEHWIRFTSAELDSGCIFISGAVAFDDQPGPVRDALSAAAQVWLDALTRAIAQARCEGHLRATGDDDDRQTCFEIHGLILAVHYEARFLRRPGTLERALRGFDRIVQGLGPTQQPLPNP
jgi:AcrR family transcriptional regulator